MAKWITFGNHLLNAEHIVCVTEHGGSLSITMVTGAVLSLSDAEQARAREALIAVGVPLATAADRPRPKGRVLRTDD